MAVCKECDAPRGGGSARAACRYLLGEELTAKVKHDAHDDPLKAEQKTDLALLFAEARARPDLGAGVIWQPQAGGGVRPSAVYARPLSKLTRIRPPEGSTRLQTIGRSR